MSTTPHQPGIKADPSADVPGEWSGGRKRDRGVQRRAVDNSIVDDHHPRQHNPRIVARVENAKYKTPGRDRYSAFKELIGAAALYWVCITAPAVIGFAVRFYEEYILDFIDDLHNTWLIVQERELENDAGGSTADLTYYDTLSRYAAHYSDQASSYACEYMPNVEWCAPAQAVSRVEDTSTGYLASLRRFVYHDSTPMNDFILVMFLAMCLAMVRVLLVSILVPRALAPRRLAALTRCKSSHMLSSTSYEFSPVRALKRRVRASFTGNFLDSLEDLNTKEDSKVAVGARSVGDGINNDEKYEGQESNVSVVHVASLRERVRTAMENTMDSMYSFWCTIRASIRRSLGHEPAASYENLDATTTLRLFSAPRYATALFRCLYCSGSCIMAWFLFRSANFWPVYVGGRPTSSTRNCWNRSGSIALGSLDADFDHYNAALHIFFLAQGAYQLHSLWFHILSMVLLLLYEEGNERMVSMKSSMKSYLRPLTEHLISLTIIILCYVFSGLRRLGAVGIFTLESSSISLQLLQVAINAPETASWLRQPKTVKRLHRYVVVPSFLYCRFFVFPFIVWYSAAFESQDWLEQIEKVFVPGSAFALYTLFNVMIAFIFGLNLVFFRRLLFHPHLSDFFRQAKEDEESNMYK